MRFVRLLAAAAALLFSGQAEAAKIFTLTGSTTGAVGIDIPDMDPAYSTGSHSLGFRFTFAQPFRGSVGYEAEYTYYINDKNGLEIDANEIDLINNYVSVNGANSAVLKFRLPTSKDMPGWFSSNAHTTINYFLRPGGVAFLYPTDDQATVNYSITGFHSAPEPSTWALMIMGFGGVGAAVRRRRLKPSAQAISA